MLILLPVICLAVVAIALLLDRDKTSYSFPSIAEWAGLAAILIAMAAAAKHFTKPGEMAPIVYGLAGGTITGILSRLLDPFKPHGSAIVALGVLAPSFFLWLAPETMRTACLAASVAAAASAVILSGRTTALAALVCSVVGFGDLMGSHVGTTQAMFSSGAVIAASIALLGLVGLAILKLAPKLAKAWPFIASAIAFGMAYATVKSYLFIGPGWFGISIAPLCAIVVYWLMASKDEDAFQVLVSAIIWIGLATIAFGTARGFGIVLTLVFSTALLVVLGADRALLSTGPLLGLAMHRVFRQEHTDASYAIDIGQHYSLIGLALGALAPLMPEEWLTKFSPANAYRRSAGSFLWICLALATPALVALFLAPKGLLGFVTGLGFSGFLGVYRRSATPVVLALAAGLGALSVIQYDWLEPISDLERGDKLHWLAIAAGGILLLSLVLAALRFRVASPKLATEAA